MERAARKAAPRLRRDFSEVAAAAGQPQGAGRFRHRRPIARPRQTIYEELKKARPDWGFLMEEGGAIEGDPTKPRWVVDPLDGTTNFLHGLPHFAISIAVEEPRPGGGRGEITQGLVYQPITDESFWAEKGRGAWLQDRRLRVSARRDLSEALIATGIPFLGHGNFKQWTRDLRRVAPEVAGIRRFGSAALDLAWVAAGRYRRLLGERPASRGTSRPACCWCARRAASSAISAAATGRSSATSSSPRTRGCIPSCTSWSARGAERKRRA